MNFTQLEFFFLNHVEKTRQCDPLNKNSVCKTSRGAYYNQIVIRNCSFDLKFCVGKLICMVHSFIGSRQLGRPRTYLLAVKQFIIKLSLEVRTVLKPQRFEIFYTYIGFKFCIKEKYTPISIASMKMSNMNHTTEIDSIS